MAKATVFANGLSIAAKAVDGKSIAAFPDPCWTNPGPSTGPILLPFANTAYAKDTANASRTVFIGGKPVMLKDRSYFKTSTGNEAAAYAKGLMTGVKKGKAYFASWSMDIKIEGYNTCRHTDLMTHNHGSQPGNTTYWHYTDKAGGKPPNDCFKDCVEIEEACGKFNKGECKSCAAEARCGGKPDNTSKGKDEKDKDKKKEDDKLASKKKGVVSKLKQLLKKKGINLPTEPTWKFDECFPCAVFKPGMDVQKQIDCLTKQLNALEEGFEKMKKFYHNGVSLDKVMNGVEMSDLDIWDLVPIPLGKAKSIRRIIKAEEYSELAQHLRETLSDIYVGAQQAIDKLNLTKGFFEQYKKATPEEIESAVVGCVAANKCLTKRRCMLEPYKSSKMPKSMFSKQGCCPGQTAHHLVPNSSIQGERGKNGSNVKGCSDYRHDDAPTVCVEGYSQNQGTHKEIHDETARELAQKLNGTKPVTYQTVKNAGLKAYNETFKRSKCSSKCLETQLDQHYKEACGKNAENTEFRRVNGKDATVYEPDDYCKSEPESESE